MGLLLALARRKASNTAAVAALTQKRLWKALLGCCRGVGAPTRFEGLERFVSVFLGVEAKPPLAGAA